ncbi:MAG TPA: flagellar biosynthetic protein FliO [Chloroflexota bacterium]|nr:flagellar biosynthetic protein FliO [Chloroflexota bacterium]
MLTPDAPGDLLWDVIVKTALVLALLYGVLWLVKRYYGRTASTPKGAGIVLIQSTHLGPGRALHLVGVGSRTLLLGATSQQVSLLAELDPTDLESEPNSVEGYSFDRYLNQASGVAGMLSSRLRELRRRRDEGDRPDGGVTS